MAEFPALPLWTDSYLADTRHLSTLEHGAYMLLLMEAWRRPHCDLPDDDRMLARLAGVSTEEWEEIKPIVMDFWRYDGRRKTWAQKRLSSERDYVANKSRSQKDKARKRWKGTKKPDATALPDNMPEACPDDAPTPTPSSTVPNGTGGAPPSLKDQLWSSGLAIVVSTGIPERQARSLIGKWRKLTGDANTLDLLAEAQAQSVSDLVPWMEAAVRSRGVGPPKRESYEDRMKRERQEYIDRNYGSNSPRAQREREEAQS